MKRIDAAISPSFAKKKKLLDQGNHVNRLDVINIQPIFRQSSEFC